MIAAAYYGNLTNRNVKVSCHTFGAPKVGDANFVEWMTKGIEENVNIVNQNDIVPYLPVKKVFKDNNNIFMPMSSCNVYVCHDLDSYIENLRKHIEMQKLPEQVK